MPTFASTDGPKSAVPIKNHRYQIPRYPFDRPMHQTGPDVDKAGVPGTGMLVPWTRVSTIVDTHKDKEGIVKWKARLTAKGLASRPDLVALAASLRLEEKYEIGKVVDQAFDYAKGQAAANLGTALHNFLERWVRGDKELVIPEPWKSDVAAVMTAFQDAGIELVPELQECVVVRPDLKDGDSAGMAGRFDLVVRWNGQLTMADYKTGSDPLEYGSLEIQQQLGIYPTGWAIWDGTHWRPMPDIRRDKVLMVHVLPGQASVQIHEIDVDPAVLEADFEAAYRTRRRRKEAKKAHRPIVTVEEGVIVYGQELNPIGGMEPDGIGEAARHRAQMDAERAAATVARVAAESNPNDGDDEGPTVYRTSQTAALVGTASMTIEELAPLAGPSERGSDRFAEVENARQAGELAYDGSLLQPLAGPGERGCGVCGRKGHRRGSPKCLGENDPAKGTMLRASAMSQEASASDPEDVPGVARIPSPTPGPNGLVVGPVGPLPDPEHCRCTARSKGWTAPADGGPWVCGDCGLPSRAGQINGSGRPADPMATVVPMMNAAERSLVREADRIDEERMTMAAVEPDAMEAAIGEQLDAEGIEEPDPFDEGGSEVLEPLFRPWLDRIAGAESKADLRDIRAEALEVGEWTAELTAAGLERMKSFAPKG